MATKDSKWMTIDEAMESLNIGDVRMQQLRQRGDIKCKRTRNQRGRMAYTHARVEDVLAYDERIKASPRLSASRKTGLAMRGTQHPKPAPKAEAPKAEAKQAERKPRGVTLAKFGDVYRMPEDRKVFIVGKDGLTKVDAAKLIVI